MTTQTTEKLPSLFTAADRCDRCGAQAHMSAILSGGSLLFCGHHGHQYRAALEAAGAVIYEEEVVDARD